MDKEKMQYIIPHKVFNGDRPSSLLLFDGYLNAYKTGQILSIFEHRTVVQGFLWNVGWTSFDYKDILYPNGNTANTLNQLLSFGYI